ncbi:amino acid ABC transporter substrate-binding protein [Pyruvatibacter mobilis]|uniref:amino acid ABC transporter substrate-binding protein n=1 Tax=Pyruvatibacter mobilis TaxID=1712261 RepID=UPI003BABA263
MTTILLPAFKRTAAACIGGLAMAAAFSTSALAAPADAGPTLSAVKERGFVQCGVNQGLPGFANPDATGEWTGLDVDLCRAVAAGIFGDPSAARYRPLSAKERFTALQSREIDVLTRNTTWTMDRDTSLGLNFAGVNYYDGQGMMVRKDLGITSALDLNGANLCTNSGTTTELNIADFFRANNLEYKIISFEKSDEVVGAYDAGRCDVYTTDVSGLAAQRLKLKDPDAHIILDEIISKEPLGPVVRQGDDQWLDIVRWTLNVMIEAEELGINSANVDEMKASENPAIKRLLGTEGAYGEALGLSNDWAYNIIKSVGNYGESFERHVGSATPLALKRGQNALYKDGGLHYAMPVR